MTPIAIDINCDMGESFGRFIVGNDQALFPYISSCNIACGFHGGDPYHMEQTIAAALAHNVRIGAHPSYPDLAGFGRRPMSIPATELKAIIKYQVAALKGMVESQGGRLHYVKPHGALYNEMAKNNQEAAIVIEAIQSIDSSLALMGLAESSLIALAAKMGIDFIAEAFIDRRYQHQTQLVSRKLPQAVIQEEQLATQQFLRMIQEQKVQTDYGFQALQAQSFCIHGDNPNAVAILKALHQSMEKHQICLVS